MSDCPSVLFVCLGNICRSPLAEAVFRDKANHAGLSVRVDSAGTGDWNVGNPPDPRARDVASQNDLDISGLRARQVTRADFERFTHVIAMDQWNLDSLHGLCPGGSNAKISLFLDHVPGREGENVVDPWFGSSDGFAATWDDVSAGAVALVRELLKT